MKLLIGSRNAHKLAEIRAMLAVPDLDVVGASDIPGLPEVEEDGQTFQANAVKKAVMLALRAKLWTLADDSGLEVEALGGEPGVRSSRYAGEPGDHAANNARLLERMRRAPRRTARFVCVIALSSPSGRAQIVEGLSNGLLLEAPRGAGGFGYDPLFVPDGFSQTFAEMDAALKNTISHRARALRLALDTWGDLLAGAAEDWPSTRSGRRRAPRGEAPLP